MAEPLHCFVVFGYSWICERPPFSSFCLIWASLGVDVPERLRDGAVVAPPVVAAGALVPPGFDGFVELVCAIAADEAPSSNAAANTTHFFMTDLPRGVTW